MSEKIKITRIETNAVSIPYRYPWRNKHTEERGEPMTHLDTTIIRVHTDAGITGLGEARGSDVLPGRCACPRRGARARRQPEKVPWRSLPSFVQFVQNI